MLSDRKKYNYMMNSDFSYRERSRPKYDKQNNQYSMSSGFRDSSYKPSSQYQQKIAQLEKMNKNLVEGTAKQFQQFEEDVARVQNILQQKQKQNQLLQNQNKQLLNDKSMLVEALGEKDYLIQQLQSHIEQLMIKNDQNQNQMEEKKAKEESIDVEVQTEEVEDDHTKKQNELQEEKNKIYKKYEQMVVNCQAMNEQIFQLKDELFSVNSELNLLKQEQSTMKLLHEIQAVKNQ